MSLICSPRCSRLFLIRLPKSSCCNLTTDSARDSKEHSTAKIGPAVRNLFEQYRIKSEDVRGSGPRGFVLKGDVLKFIQEQKLRPSVFTAPPPKAASNPAVKAAEPGTPGPKDPRGRVKYVDYALSENLRKSAADSVKAKTAIPHAYTYAVCVVDQALKHVSGEGEPKPADLLPFVIRAVLNAARRTPSASNGGVAAHSFFVDKYVGAEKLQRTFIPNAKTFDPKILSGERTKENDDHGTQSADFRIVSLIGSRLDQLTPILESQQLWALSAGDVLTRVAAGDKAHVKITNLALSYNAAKMSDEEASAFLEQIKNFIQRPALMLLGGSTSRKE